MSFPREEALTDLVGERTYSEYTNWRVFRDLDGEMPGVNVLIVLGDSWTMISAADFLATAERIQRQIE